MSMSTPAIEITNLSYQYPGNWIFDSRPVLHPFSLTVHHGESFGFLGHNGAGKSTTMKALLNVNRVKHGTITLYGVPHTSREARCLLGYVPEHPYFYDHLTVEELLSFYGKLAGIPATDLRKSIDWALSMVKIDRRRGEKLRSLSKGLVQRVSMAQAIIARPKILLLDEPFSGLDPIGRKDFKDLLALLKGEGTTIFMASHILSDVEFLCDRVSIMSKGVLKKVFSVSEIPTLSAAKYEISCEPSPHAKDLLTKGALKVTHESNRVVGIFETREQSEGMVRELLNANVRIDSFNTVQNSLEDVFVRTVDFEEE